MAKKDLYKTLGVEKTAKPEEVKRAYRKKAQKNHPDKGGDSEEFKEAAEAYAVLIDPVKRERYDKTGEIDAQSDPSLSLLAEILNHVLCSIIQSGRDPEKTNLLNRMREEIAKRSLGISGDIAENKKRAEKIRKVAARLTKKKGEEENVLVEIILAPAKALEQAIASQEAHRLALNRCKTLLDDYAYAHDPEEPMKVNSSGFEFALRQFPNPGGVPPFRWASWGDSGDKS